LRDYHAIGLQKRLWKFAPIKLVDVVNERGGRAIIPRKDLPLQCAAAANFRAGTQRVGENAYVVAFSCNARRDGGFVIRPG